MDILNVILICVIFVLVIFGILAFTGYLMHVLDKVREDIEIFEDEEKRKVNINVASKEEYFKFLEILRKIERDIE